MPTDKQPPHVDICNRLRSATRIGLRKSRGKGVLTSLKIPVCLEAANEIERLRVVIDRITLGTSKHYAIGAGGEVYGHPRPADRDGAGVMPKDKQMEYGDRHGVTWSDSSPNRMEKPDGE